MTSAYPAQLPRPLVKRLVETALAEDLGPAGDVTSQATLPPRARAECLLAARQPGIVAGLDLVAAAFAAADPSISFKPHVSDTHRVEPGTPIAHVSGNARSILSAERVALNFMCHLSGIATETDRYVAAIAGTNARICDTRKTTPGLRAVEKYAVRCGGGSNHRFGLDDAILIKDNHIAVAGGVAAAIAAARAYAGHLMAIEVEVDTLAQFEEALGAGADAVLLDNMDPATLRRAVEAGAGRARLEASGGIGLDNVAAVAQTGVDYISSSRITMAAVPLDIGLDIEIEA